MGLIETIDVNPREGIWENCFVSDGAQCSQPQYYNLSFLKHLLECKILGKQDLVFCSLIYSRHLEQHLASNEHSINVCSI